MKATKKSKPTSASSKRIDALLHKVSFREIKILCEVLRDLSVARTELVRARFKQDGLHFAEVLDFLTQLAVLESAKGRISQKEKFGTTDDEMKAGLIQRLFARDTPFQFHANEFIGNFQSADGNFEIVMDTEMRRRFGGIRNLFLDLEFLEKDIDKPRYWVSLQYLDTFFEAKSQISTSPADLKNILRAREKLGRDAELEVLKFERARLRHNPNLAKQIKHVAVENIGAGYDILSFTESANSSDFSDRFIEVKAVSPADFKFFWSRNEIEAARIHGAKYFVYLLPVSKFGFDIQELKIVENPFEVIFQNEIRWQREHELISFWLK